MASLTIIPYTPVPTKDRYCTSKLTNDRGKEHETKLSTLPVNTPQLQATAVAGNAGDLATHDELPLEGRASSVSAFLQSQNHSCGQQYLDRSSSVIRDDVSDNSDLEIDSLYKDSGDTEPTTETESKSGSPRIWGIESEIGDTEIVRNPLKRKAGTGGQGSQDNPWVIPDSDTESDTESWDGLAWKKRKVCSQRRTIDVTDDEADSAEFGSTRVRAGDIHSESDSASDRDSEGREQAHPSPAALSAHYSALFKSDERVKAQSVARVGGNGEWGIHGIIGKEVIDGVVYYCVDWQPTMLPLNQLKGAWRLIQEFEEKQGRHRKQK